MGHRSARGFILKGEVVPDLPSNRLSQPIHPGNLPTSQVIPQLTGREGQRRINGLWYGGTPQIQRKQNRT